MSYTNKRIWSRYRIDNIALNANINNNGYQLNGIYPYLLLTGRATAVHFHSCTHWLWHSAKMNWHRSAQIHPETADKIIGNGNAKSKPFVNGDKRDTFFLLWNGIAKDTIFVPIGFGDKQQVHSDIRKSIYSDINTLTNNKILNT